MNDRRWVRQGHRWLSIAFTLSVAANFVAMLWEAVPAWVTYSPLLPLLLLVVTGLTMLVQPYAAAWQAIVGKGRGREISNGKSSR